MLTAIAHRGPCGQGVFVDSENGLALGNRRLSIIDLSGAGSQPMTSTNGRWVISFNGEIYNFEEMRRRLSEVRGHSSWTGGSDTEVLLDAISTYGFKKALELANGMFAIAAWDRRERVLYLARDRMGEKPLYFGWQGGTFLFASELKAIAAHPSFTRTVDAASVSLYLSYGYLPNPWSIYRGISQLQPGCFLVLPVDSTVGATPAVERYWHIPTPSESKMDAADAVNEVDALLRDATALRMRADVPIGSFLSGGVDSSLVVTLMQALSATSVRSYSVGFAEKEFDESPYAKLVSDVIGTVHQDIQVDASDAKALIPRLPDLYDEPFADPSAIPTFFLSKLASNDVTVALTGDGGDELFGGYQRYFDFERRWNNRLPIPKLVRRQLPAAVRLIPDSMLRIASTIGGPALRKNLVPYRLRRIAASARCETEHDFYQFLMELWSPGMLASPIDPARAIFFRTFNINQFGDTFLGQMFLDTATYLPDDILVKVDRASMATSLEVRVPLLDHRLVEFAFNVPLGLKRKDERGKWLLRSLLSRYLPSHICDRPKQGFSIPLSDWLRGPLKSWAEDVLWSGNTDMREFIDLDGVRAVWREHVDAGVDHGFRLWAVLMLLIWADKWRPTVQ